MKTSFLLAWRTLLRGRFMPLLLLGAAAVMLLMPSIIRSDGTISGARELYIHSILGSVIALVFLSVLCAACGHLAKEREAHRLSLAVIRPSDAFRMMLGVWFAYVSATAATLAVIAVAIYLRAPGGAVPCRHHIPPILPSPMSIALASIDEYLARPSTPDEVRKLPRNSILAHMAANEADRFEAIAPNSSASWNFPAQWTFCPDLRIQVRFATQFSARAPFSGEFSFGASRAVVSNNTQSVIEVPLSFGKGEIPLANIAAAQTAAVFKNTGPETIMLRPRKDLFILAPADSFAANLFRAMLHSLSGIALAAAFGLFLSSALSRPVATFTALVTVAVIFIAPNVIDQLPDGAGQPLGDRIGLLLSRGIHAVTASFTDASPISDLAENRCIEWPTLIRAVGVDAFLLPLAFLGLGTFLVRRKALPDANQGLRI